MRIWLATVGEPLPTDGAETRLLRTGQFASWLCERGHDVTFLTGTMDHNRRQLRSPETLVHEITENYRVVTLAGRHYKKSISFARFRNHADVATSFSQIAHSLPRPDIILSSYPTEELCRAALNYAEPLDIPVVIDARDFWPDIFGEMLPRPFQWLAPLVFKPLERKAGETLARATALCGMTQSAMNWAIRKAGRQTIDHDFWFPFTYAAPRVYRVEQPERKTVNLLFLGTLSHRSNLENVISAMHLVSRRNGNIHLHICGTGEAEQTLRGLANGLGRIHFHGWLDAAGLSAIMTESDVGVLPYDRPDFHLSLPNKFAEYLAGSLAVLSCTEGEVRKQIDETGCGIWAAPTTEALAEAILALTPDRIASMQERASAVFDKTFSPDAVFQKAFDALSAITSSR